MKNYHSNSHLSFYVDGAIIITYKFIVYDNFSPQHHHDTINFVNAPIAYKILQFRMSLDLSISFPTIFLLIMKFVTRLFRR